MADYAALKNHQEKLIRKALQGSVFLAPSSADVITNLTAYTAGPPAGIGRRRQAPEHSSREDQAIRQTP